MITFPRRRELYTRSNNKRDIGCGNGMRRKRSVDDWIKRSRKKNPPWNNGDSGLKRTIACASYIRARLSIHPRNVVSHRGRKTPPRETPLPGSRERTRHCFEEHREKRGTEIPFVASRALASCMQTVEKLTRAFVIIRFPLTTSFVYKRQERGLWNIFITRTREKPR